MRIEPHIARPAPPLPAGAPALTRFNVLGALLCALMLSSLTLVLAGLVQRILPTWQPLYLVGASFVIALEAAFIQYVARRQRMWIFEVSAYLVAEIVVLLALMRVVASIGLGPEQWRLDLALWLRSPLDALDHTFLAHTLAGLLIGGMARNTAHDLQELEPRQFDTALSDDLHGQLYRSRSDDERGTALRRINGRFIFGGVALLLAMALQVVNIERIAAAPLPVPPVVGVAGLVYLVSGFLLYSQARLAWLRARWHLDGAEVDPRVIKRWTRVSVLLIAGIALGALVLPRSYGLGLLDTFRALLAQVLWLLHFVVFQIAVLVMAIIGLLMALPSLLLAWLNGVDLPQSAPVQPPPLVPPDLPPVSNATPPLLPSLVFWLCMLLLVGYALWTIVQRHAGIQHAIRVFKDGPLRRMLERFGLFWRGLRSYSQHVVLVLAEHLRPPPRPVAARRIARHRARLAPRDLVRYFYRSVLLRAANHGFRRRRAQTPYEYSTKLAEALPDARDDIAALTEAFVAATYSPQPPTQHDSERVRGPWKRLSARLRRQHRE